MTPIEHTESGPVNTQVRDGDLSVITFVKDYVDGRMNDHAKLTDLQAELVKTRFEALSEATKLGLKNLDIRFANTNEWRTAFDDRERDFARKSDVEKLETAVGKLQIGAATLAGKASQNSVIFGYFIALAGLLLSIVSFLMRMK